SAASVAGSDQPSLAARMNAYTSAAIPVTDVSAPARSKCPGRRGVSARRNGAQAATTIPTGRLMKNAQRQDSHWVMAPPSTRPSEAPPLAIAAYRAIALFRLLPSGNADTTSASAAGEAIAPPTPCIARAPISQAGDDARPAASDDSVNTTMPGRKTRRRPRMSTAPPPSSSRPPQGTGEAVSTQGRLGAEK